MKEKNNQVIEKKHKFTFIDATVIVVLVVIALVVFLSIDPFKWFDPDARAEEKNVICVFQVKNVDKAKSNSVVQGEQLNFKDLDMAEIVKVNKVQGTRWEVSSEGDMILIRNPEKDTLFVTLELKCTYREGVGYFFHGYQLAVGDRVNLKFKMFDAVGECVDIKVKE